jgi:hypothetical protein
VLACRRPERQVTSSRDRFVRLVLCDPEGGAARRALYYLSRLVLGAVVGFFVVAMATPSRERGGEGFSLEVYLAAMAAGAVLALALAWVPRLLRPKDWPTRDEFRRGGRPPDRRAE